MIIKDERTDEQKKTPRVEGYTPIISGKVTRISRSKRNSWRSETLVDGCAMSLSHHDTKADAESHCKGMIKAYAESHYITQGLECWRVRFD